MGHLLLHYMKLEVLWQSINQNPRFSQRDPIQLASEFFFFFFVEEKKKSLEGWPSMHFLGTIWRERHMRCFEDVENHIKH